MIKNDLNASQLLSRVYLLVLCVVLSGCSFWQNSKAEYHHAKTESLIDRMESARQLTQYSQTKFQRLLDAYLGDPSSPAKVSLHETYWLAYKTIEDMDAEFKAIDSRFAEMTAMQNQNVELSVKAKATVNSSYQYYQELKPLISQTIADGNQLLKIYDALKNQTQGLTVDQSVEVTQKTDQLIAMENKISVAFSKLVVGLQLAL